VAKHCVVLQGVEDSAPATLLQASEPSKNETLVGGPRRWRRQKRGTLAKSATRSPSDRRDEGLGLARPRFVRVSRKNYVLKSESG
jgi:hypothetical protein